MIWKKQLRLTPSASALIEASSKTPELSGPIGRLCAKFARPMAEFGVGFRFRRWKPVSSGYPVGGWGERPQRLF
jgi:hypothetical protein